MSASPYNTGLWHVVDTGSIWLKEFAFALGTMVPTRNWWPETRNFGAWENWERIEQVADPPISVTRFPLQRGYARFPLARLFPFEETMVKRLIHQTQGAETSTLICTSPYYVPLAERWPGRVVYYLTDLTKEYAGVNPAQVVECDRRMCSVADTVCPNSERISEYLRREAGCDREKITVIPNATRLQSLLKEPLTEPGNLPLAIADLPRPIVGVIGNMAGNVDWNLLANAVKKARNVSWAFVGPNHWPLSDRDGHEARQYLMAQDGRVRFVGPKPYGQLCHYARAFDAALIPYRKTEPTISGSATRYYEHLAACRPILATRAHHELLTKEPLVTLVDSGDELAASIERLRACGFRDGFEELRWKASHEGTWMVRARDLVAAASQLDVATAGKHAPHSGVQVSV
jgi:glycosyltransferase involved in cell wall biosynthesis